MVPSETKKNVFYEVNMELRLCECHIGQLKGPCKHKSIVSTTQNIPSFDVVPTQNPEMRALFMYIGTGKKPNLNWFQPLSSSSSNSILQMQQELAYVTDNVCNQGESEKEDQTTDDRNDEEKVAEVQEKWNKVLEKLQKKIQDRISGDISGYEKAIEVFEKHVDRLPVSKDSVLQKSLSSFAGTFTEAMSVKKRKKGAYINVQATSKSRRAIALRGSRAAYFGAPRKSKGPKTQLIESRGEQIVAHKLPGKSKKIRKKHPHNLMDAVLAGRAAEKKH